MKFVLGIVLLFAAAKTFAWEPDNSKNLADLLYIPNEGRLYGQTSFEWISLSGEVAQGATEVDLTSQNNTFYQTVGYGITERLQVNLRYANQVKGLTTVEDNSNSENDGPANPEIGGLFRILKQQDDSVTLDVLFNYAPDLFDSESNSNTSKSDNAAGGAVYTLGVRAGKKFTNLEMMGQFGLRLNGKAESEDTATNEKTKDDAHAETQLAYWVQFPLSEGFWARAKLEMNTVGEYDSKDSSGEKTEREMNTASELAGSLLYSPLNDHLVLEAGIGLIGASDFETKSGGTKTKFRDLGGSRLFLSALYQF